MLFNETYYLVDGGTIWTNGKESDAPDMQDLLPQPEIGHFAYLESYEYRMYNTYDVHFSASFALATLWPELERAVQEDFVHSVEVSDPENVIMWSSGKKVPRKKTGMLPHDLGSPTASPWQQINAYLYQDISRWKDLNSKFVLQIYRDYLLNKDRTFLEAAWPALQQSVATLGKFDRDGDGMIENDGYPDQTYDTWTATGPSAYTGGLWLACLNAMRAIAQTLGFSHESEDYKNRLERAQAVYENRLWNGSYYNYDCSKGRRRLVIMADQLAGQWFGKACGLPDILPPDHIASALKEILENNVRKFSDGECGAVNGMYPDGKLDRTNLQSREMWAGTTFSLAACMLQEGLIEEAFETAKGVYLAIYRDYGLFFQTPEAINDAGAYRAYGYMRPLAIWAMQWELEKLKHG